MKKLSKNGIIKLVSLLLTLLLVAKLIALILWYVLPESGVELQKSSGSAMAYHRVSFTNMIDQKSSSNTTSTKSKEYDIRDLLLNGLYGTKEYGYAIVAKKSDPTKTKIISVGESFAGYKLKEIHLKHVVFTRDSKNYVLKLNEKIDKQANTYVQEVVQEEEKNSVYRSDIEHYAKNFRQIWKDISIVPLKNGKKIEGFKVTKIREGSKMSELGLQKGDIIIKANNVRLSSFNDAIKLYKNIDKIDTLELVILRDNQEKEIIYEIN